MVEVFRRNNAIKYFYFKLFSPKLSFFEKSIEKYYLFKRTDTPWLNYKTFQFNPAINRLFNEWSEIVENEYFIHYDNPCLIEPYYGWIIINKNKVLKAALPYGLLEKTPLP